MENTYINIVGDAEREHADGLVSILAYKQPRNSPRISRAIRMRIVARNNPSNPLYLCYATYIPSPS